MWKRNNNGIQKKSKYDMSFIEDDDENGNGNKMKDKSFIKHVNKPPKYDMSFIDDDNENENEKKEVEKRTDTRNAKNTHKSPKYDMSFIDADDNENETHANNNDHHKHHVDLSDHGQVDYDTGLDLLENFHADEGNLLEYSDEEYSVEYQNEKAFHQQNYYGANKYSMNVPSYNNKNYSKHRHNQNHNQYGGHHKRHYQNQNKGISLSPGDQYRKKIADENRKIVRKHPELIDWNGIKTIGIDHHFNIPNNINRKCSIHIIECSTIKAAIDVHSSYPSSKICLLNFANPIKPGGGYLNGREGQEGSICRQTLLYPTLEKSYMYFENKQKGNRPEASDVMIYSPNVLVIRDDKYEMIHNFPVDIISVSAVDNRNYHISNSEKIMENRIRKIILTAVSEKTEILILGAFGCGIFKNDPTIIASIFKKILVEENYKNYFHVIIFPIYKDSMTYHIFDSILSNK